VTIHRFGRVTIQGDDPSADDAIMIEYFHFEGSDGTLGAQREALVEARARITAALQKLDAYRLRAIQCDSCKNITDPDTCTGWLRVEHVPGIDALPLGEPRGPFHFDSQMCLIDWAANVAGVRAGRMIATEPE
jgi:hypothetical protein